MKKLKVEQETYTYIEKLLFIVWVFFCGMFLLDFTIFVVKIFGTIFFLYLMFVMFFVDIVKKE